MLAQTSATTRMMIKTTVKMYARMVKNAMALRILTMPPPTVSNPLL